jgi:hypothetical protein
MKLCQFKHIFGVPGQGVHRVRFGDAAATDYFLTIVGAWLLNRWTGVPIVLGTIGLFVLGILLHWVFCVPTGAVKYLSR